MLAHQNRPVLVGDRARINPLFGEVLARRGIGSPAFRFGASLLDQVRPVSP